MDTPTSPRIRCAKTLEEGHRTLRIVCFGDSLTYGTGAGPGMDYPSRLGEKLGREIIKSNIDVTLRILDPKLRISPNVIRVRATQRSDLGRVTYANSITLVPGTVAMSVEADEITVHALTWDVAADLQRGEMDRRITAMERDL